MADVLRQRIEAALAQHYLPSSNPHCVCGNWPDNAPDEQTFFAHQTDVLLSVLQPDIDTIAEAMATAHLSPPSWTAEPMEHYRTLARAAVDAMKGEK